MPASCADHGKVHPRTTDGDTAAKEGMALAVDLFERYHQEIYAYLCGMVRDGPWAEDLAQETFLRVLRARRRLPQVRNHRAWLYRIASNVALTALRRWRRFAWLPWRAGDQDNASPDVAEQVGRKTVLEAALAGLPPMYRAPLLLYAQYGLRPAEVAEALGLSEAAARKRIYRATLMFRQAYGKRDTR